MVPHIELPMVGRRYYVEFPTMSFYLYFVSDKALEFTVEKSPDLPKGSAHTVDISIQRLRDELYLVSWQEKSGNTVVHLEDFKEPETLPPRPPFSIPAVQL